MNIGASFSMATTSGVFPLSSTLFILVLLRSFGIRLHCLLVIASWRVIFLLDMATADVEQNVNGTQPARIENKLFDGMNLEINFTAFES